MPATKHDTWPAHTVANGKIADYLPRDAEAGDWRRLMTEVQMLFHAHSVNIERANQQKLPINAMWFFAKRLRRDAGTTDASATISATRTTFIPAPTPSGSPPMPPPATLPRNFLPHFMPTVEPTPLRSLRSRVDACVVSAS